GLQEYLWTLVYFCRQLNRLAEHQNRLLDAEPFAQFLLHLLLREPAAFATCLPRLRNEPQQGESFLSFDIFGFHHRWFAFKTFFRSRIDTGVTSTNSSSRINSMACSRFKMRGGTSRIASSAVDARILVSFFSLTMLTFKSASRAFSPTIMPS